jgi:hypothetical protein
LRSMPHRSPIARTNGSTKAAMSILNACGYRPVCSRSDVRRRPNPCQRNGNQAPSKERRAASAWRAAVDTVRNGHRSQPRIRRQDRATGRLVLCFLAHFYAALRDRREDACEMRARSKTEVSRCIRGQRLPARRRNKRLQSPTRQSVNSTPIRLPERQSRRTVSVNAILRNHELEPISDTMPS